PPRWPTSSPVMNTRSSRPSSSSMPCRMASMSVISAMRGSFVVERRVDVLGRGRVGIGRGQGKLHRVVHLGHSLGLQVGLLLGRQVAGGFQVAAEELHRVALLPLFHFVAGAIGAVV